MASTDPLPPLLEALHTTDPVVRLNAATLLAPMHELAAVPISIEAFNHQLETPRLRLRLMQPDDSDALFRIFADPQVMAAFVMPLLNREQVMHWKRMSFYGLHASLF